MKAFSLALLAVSPLVFAQNVAQKLETSVENLMNSPAASSANLSVFVTDGAGKTVYEFNPNIGLSTASTQKIFTAACALELLGADYKYTTTASYSGNVSSGKLSGNLFINSDGDPTLGSWRYEGYRPEDFRQKLLEALRQNQISTINGDIIIDDSAFDFQNIPGGWPWNDMGNYYGAGVWGVNWRENQFDIGMNGGSVKKISTELPGVEWVSEVKSGGSSDQSLIFTAPHSNVGYINGMLPAKNITISGAMPNPPLTLGYEVKKWLSESGILLNGNVKTISGMKVSGEKVKEESTKNILIYQSPGMDKIVYWFLRKSVNLYGETLIKTLAKKKRNTGTFSAGVEVLKDFWTSKGIRPSMINFADGSGLSPQNYVSSKAEVQALLYAKKQAWFQDFYDGFPTMENGIKMKSGTMKNTKSFAGYHTSKDGKSYVFSIIINNYQGTDASAALQNILNNLK